MPSGPTQRVLGDYDDDTTTDVLAAMFELLGHETRTASGGLEALRIVDEFAPGLVVLDLGLTDMNGCEVARTVREGPHSDAYIVAATGWDRPRYAARATESGVDEYLLKPIDLAKIRHMLDAAARHREALDPS